MPAELAAIMWPEVPSLVEEMVDEIARLIPEYDHMRQEPGGGLLQVATEQSLTVFVEQVVDANVSTSQRDELFRKLGELEAYGGRDLEQLRAALRIGARVAVRRARTVGTRHNISSDLLLTYADRIMAYTDTLEALCNEGYTEAKAGVDAPPEAQRRRLLRLILTGSAAARPVIAELAAAVGWPLPEHVTLIALGGGRKPSRTALDKDVLVDLDDRHPCLLVPGDLDRSRQSMLYAALIGCQAAFGLAVRIEEAADSIRWARRLLRLAESGVVTDGPVVKCEDHLITLWLASDPALTDQLAKRLFTPLEGGTRGRRDRFLETLRAWLSDRGKTTPMAERLRMHPQSVRYRVRQLEERLGDRLNDAEFRFASEVVLRSWELHGNQANGSTPSRA